MESDDWFEARRKLNREKNMQNPVWEPNDGDY